MHFFLPNIFSRGLKFLQVFYENFDCDLTQGFFIRDLNKYIFYDDINFCDSIVLSIELKSGATSNAFFSSISAVL